MCVEHSPIGAPFQCGLSVVKFPVVLQFRSRPRQASWRQIMQVLLLGRFVYLEGSSIRKVSLSGRFSIRKVYPVVYPVGFSTKTLLERFLIKAPL